MSEICKFNNEARYDIQELFCLLQTDKDKFHEVLKIGQKYLEDNIERKKANFLN